jgi:hypothetical protein
MTEETNTSGKKTGVNWSQVITAVVITAIVSIGGTFICIKCQDSAFGGTNEFNKRKSS